MSVSWIEKSVRPVLHTSWWTGKGLGDATEIDDDGLNTVAFAFNLGLQALHLVAVERVGDILILVSVGSRYSPRRKPHTRRMLMLAMVAAKLKNF